MTNDVRTQVGCLLVGEYVDEAEVPAGLTAQRGEVVRPQVVASYLDLWGKDDGLKEFTVLFRDGRIVTVRGHSLKLLPDAAPGEGGVYGVVVRAAGEELIVALFKSDKVDGIFHGEMRSERKIA
jgi:hypothetical protein